ncbi:MAG: branched-chain amino acid ABC transporter ATP-binding protein/permease [Anaerolineae bacterium]|nr:branched-chain amino acid ABC transporter ATP-binding protein/permease [Anaerolineae bacterium]MDQ7033718.1 branched-chain amino acid ABC transporter ATP-binding protein/permease [Anaerolineae bacterium]
MAIQNIKEKQGYSDLLEKVVPWISPLTALACFIALYLLAPEWNRSNLRLATFGLMWVALASSWNMIGGYTGYVDFGHTVFVGLGGYAVGILMARLGILMGAETFADQQVINYSAWQALPISFIVGAVFAGLIGYPTLRLKGPYFAIAMLGTYVAVREIVRADFTDFGLRLTNGGVGISFLAPFANPNDIYNLMLGLTSVIFFISMWIYRSQFGKMLQAVREDEVGADMRGINTTAIKIGIFMLAGGLTATIGGVKAWWDGYVDPLTIFPEEYTIQIIMMVMLGGRGRPWGAVIGAVLFYYGRITIWANTGQQQLMITGFMLTFVILVIPNGILGILDPEDRGLLWFIRHRILGEKQEGIGSKEKFEFQEVAGDSQVKRETEYGVRDMQSRVLLEGRAVTKNFGGLRAVDEVDFKIHDGEIVGLLGPNGSGKTTLFNCISGILPMSGGEVYLDGQQTTGFAPWRINRAGLSRTFQRLRVYGKLTIFENMLLARKWKNVPPWLWLMIAPQTVRGKATELMTFLKVDHIRNNLADNISGGQQRLLEMGMTLMNDPAVVLLDEATSGVNPALVEDIKDDIRRLNRERGVTFFLIEHNMSFAMELCDRIYVLDYGKLIAHGTPQEIQNNPDVIEAYFGRDD